MARLGALTSQNGRGSAGGFLLLVSLLVSNAAAQAGEPTQKPAVGLPPIEVVVTRVPKAPHEVPASVEVIGGADLRARGVTSLGDALAVASGVAIAPGGDNGPAGAVPEFWGLREFDAFLLVVDDVPWGGALNPALATLSLRDVERIEILRGPAPVTYGATSFVGVIHVVHSAAAAGATYLGAHGGNLGTGGAAADLALSASTWKSRLSADFDRQGFKDSRTSFSRGHALWRIAKVRDADKTWFRADLTLLRQDPASPHPREGTQLSPAVPLDANHNPAGAYLNENRFALAAGLERQVLHGADWGTTASFTHAANRAFRGFLTEIANGGDNASGFKENIDLNDFYADSHLIWPARWDVRFMTGADLLFSNGEAKGATFTYSAPLNGASATAVPQPTTLNLDAGDRRIFFGGYGSAEWRPSARLSVSGGLRLNATTERHGEGENVSNTRLSGGIGVLVGVWENSGNHLRLYANYRNTFKPAAFDFSLAENEAVLKPETSHSWEGGLKVRVLGGRVDGEASVFRMDFNNLVTATIVDNLPALVNAGKTRFQGFELATDLRLAGSTWARASYSFHDGKFVDYIQTFDGTPIQLGGNRVEMSARHLFSAGVTFAPDAGFIASTSVNYTGSRYLNKRNTALVPGFTTVDAGIGYRWGRLEVRLDGRNLGDRRDAVSESEFGDAQYYRMPARTVQAGIVMKY